MHSAAHPRSLAAIVLLTITALPASGDNVATAPSTPPGIMLVEVLRELSTSSDQYLWTRLADAQGRTLFYPADDRECAGFCAEEFPPLLAANDAEPFDDWSLVRRPAGDKQWAYQSRPLHTWLGEREAGEVALAVALAEGANPTLDDASLLPPDKWRVARFDPGASIVRPDGFDIVSVDAARAVVLTDFSGFTLYTFEGNVDEDGQSCGSGCAIRWKAVAAPSLAIGSGEFSVVTRPDGTRQWTHREKPLYRFAGDLLPGDAHGRSVDKRFRVATVKKNFTPPRVAVAALPGYGDVLTLDGMTLYAGSAFEKYWAGRNLRGSFRIAYFKGKRLGGRACESDACLQDWRPFAAAPDAQSAGFWEVISRPDGARQWAYKGFALYTYRGDEAPGQIRGHSIYEFANVGDSDADVERATMLARVGNAPGGAGVYWSIAKP